MLYLVAVRAGRVPARFAPLVILTALPVAAVALGVRGTGSRRTSPALLALAALELVWAALALAVVGFAQAWRSG